MVDPVAVFVPLRILDVDAARTSFDESDAEGIELAWLCWNVEGIAWCNADEGLARFREVEFDYQRLEDDVPE